MTTTEAYWPAPSPSFSTSACRPAWRRRALPRRTSSWPGPKSSASGWPPSPSRSRSSGSARPRMPTRRRGPTRRPWSIRVESAFALEMQHLAPIDHRPGEHLLRLALHREARAETRARCGGSRRSARPRPSSARRTGEGRQRPSSPSRRSPAGGPRPAGPGHRQLRFTHESVTMAALATNAKAFYRRTKSLQEPSHDDHPASDASASRNRSRDRLSRHEPAGLRPERRPFRTSRSPAPSATWLWARQTPR